MKLLALKHIRNLAVAWFSSCVFTSFFETSYSNVQIMVFLVVVFFKQYMDVLCFHNISKMFYFGTIHRRGLGGDRTTI